MSPSFFFFFLFPFQRDEGCIFIRERSFPSDSPAGTCLPALRPGTGLRPGLSRVGGFALLPSAPFLGGKPIYVYMRCRLLLKDAFRVPKELTERWS